MEIKNFGQALNLAMRLEDTGLEVYNHAAQKEGNVTLKKMFLEFYTANQKRHKVIEAIYNENINSDMDTGILAPIGTMNEEHYPLPDKSLNTQPVRLMVEIEQSTETFYNDLLQRLQYSPRSIIRQIKKLSEENALRRLQLKDHLLA